MQLIPVSCCSWRVKSFLGKWGWYLSHNASTTFFPVIPKWVARNWELSVRITWVNLDFTNKNSMSANGLDNCSSFLEFNLDTIKVYMWPISKSLLRCFLIIKDSSFSFSEILWSCSSEDFSRVLCDSVLPCKHCVWLLTLDSKVMLRVIHHPSLLRKKNYSMVAGHSLHRSTRCQAFLDSTEKWYATSVST